MFVVLFAISTGASNDDIRVNDSLTFQSGPFRVRHSISPLVDVPYHSSGEFRRSIRLDSAVLVKLRRHERYTVQDSVSVTVSFPTTDSYLHA